MAMWTLPEHNRRHSLVALLTMLISSSVEAAQDVSERLYFEDLPVVLSASRLTQPIQEAPLTVTVIDRDMIEASGYTEIAELLRLAPGFQVSHSATWLPIATYHGLSDNFSRRMQVLVDGRTIYNPGLGQVTWRELPLALEDIERIEVVQGPNAASYGINAFAATVNIITRRGGEAPGWHAEAAGGNMDTRRYGLRYSGTQGDLAYRITLHDRSERRFDDIPDGAHDRILNARADYRWNQQDRVMMQLGLSQSEWELGTPRHTANNHSGFVQARWRRVTDAGNEWSLQFHHMQKDFKDEWVVPIIPGGLPYDRNYRVSRDGLEFQSINNPAEAIRVVWGGELRRETAQSRRFFTTDAALSGTLYRLFGSLEWRLDPKWLVQGGGMLEDHYYAGRQFAPRLSLHYLISPRHALRVGLTQAHRSPTFVEREGDWETRLPDGTLYDKIWLRQGSLAPESIVSRELGYVGDFSGSGLSLNLRLFYDSLDDLIDSRNIGPVVVDGLTDSKVNQGYNAYELDIYGLEYQLRWRPGPSSQVILSQSWAFTKDVTVKYMTDEADEKRKRLADSVPRLTSALLAMHEFPGGWQGSLGYYWTSDMHWLGEGDFIEAQGRLDLRLRKQWQYRGSRIELALVLQNLDGADAEYQRGNIFDRRQYLSLRAWF